MICLCPWPLKVQIHNYSLIHAIYVFRLLPLYRILCNPIVWNRYFKMFCVNDDDMLSRYHPGPKSVKYIIHFGSLLSLAFWLCAICHPITFLRNATVYNKVMYPPSLCHDMMTSCEHYGDVVMSAMASQITSLMIAYSIVYSGRSKKT